ncbi:MAG: hypothetical protein N2260_02525 [Syntrophobacterales bacterium]|nr:hypothetical protein [Syntrophobacterales bacterium]
MAKDMDKIIERLIEGNHRFSKGEALRANISVSRRNQVADSQNPFATVFGCADSRVPPEIIFDCGLGDLFVIRTAGHTMDNAVIETIKFGVQSLNIPLVIVLGHTNCGALLKAIESQTKEGSISWIVEQIIPAIEPCREATELLNCVVKEHIRRTTSQLQNILAPLSKKVIILGACYDLHTGLLEILEA